MKVQSVTCFVPISYPLEGRSVTAVGRFLVSARGVLQDAGLETQTVRLATPPFAEVLGDPEAARVVDLALALEAACADAVIDYVSSGPAVADQTASPLSPIYLLPEVGE